MYSMLVVGVLLLFGVIGLIAAGVVEPAVGVDRLLLTIMIDSYRVEEVPTAKGAPRKGNTDWNAESK